MAVTWTKATVTNTNPFDSTTETVIEVNNIQINGGQVLKEHYIFPDGTTDAMIQSTVEADLTAKGYVT